MVRHYEDILLQAADDHMDLGLGNGYHSYEYDDVSLIVDGNDYSVDLVINKLDGHIESIEVKEVWYHNEYDKWVRVDVDTDSIEQYLLDNSNLRNILRNYGG